MLFDYCMFWAFPKCPFVSDLIVILSEKRPNWQDVSIIRLITKFPNISGPDNHLSSNNMSQTNRQMCINLLEVIRIS